MNLILLHHRLLCPFVDVVYVLWLFWGQAWCSGLCLSVCVPKSGHAMPCHFDRQQAVFWVTTQPAIESMCAGGIWAK